MDDNKKPERGLEEISHLFLSRQSVQQKTKGAVQKEVRAADNPGSAPSGRDSTADKQSRQTPFRLAVKQNLCLLSSSSSLFAEKSFLACNLAIELAGRGFSVGLVEATTTLPNALFLLGSFCSELKSRQNRSSPTEKLPPPKLLAPEPFELMDIQVGHLRGIKAVFFDKGLVSHRCLALLDKLNSESDFLILNTPHDILRFRNTTSLTSPFFLVVSSTDPRELLRSYSLIKQACTDVAGRKIGFLIMDDTTDQKAEQAFRVIESMAQRFLSAKIDPMGMVPVGADFSRLVLARTPMLQGLRNSPAAHSIRRLTDSLIKKVLSSGKTSAV